MKQLTLFLLLLFSLSACVNMRAIGLDGQVQFTTPSTTLKVGEAATLTLSVRVKDIEKQLLGEPDGFIYSDNESSNIPYQGPGEPEDNLSEFPLDPAVEIVGDDVTRRASPQLVDGSYITTFTIEGKQPGEAKILGAFVNEGFTYPLFKKDFGLITIRVVE